MITKFQLFENEYAGKVYPFHELTPFINWFNLNFGKIAISEGWSIYDSDTEGTKWIKQSKGSLWQIQTNDDDDAVGILKSAKEIDALAEKAGLLLDEYGIVIGYNGVSFVDNPEGLKELELYKDMIKYNL